MVDGCDVVTDVGDGCGVVTDGGNGCGVVTDGGEGCDVVTDGGNDNIFFRLYLRTSNGSTLALWLPK